MISSSDQIYVTHPMYKQYTSSILTFLTNFPLSKLMTTASSMSISSKCRQEEGFMPMMYGRGEQTKSIRLLGNTGIKTCCKGVQKVVVSLSIPVMSNYIDKGCNGRG